MLDALQAQVLDLLAAKEVGEQTLETHVLGLDGERLAREYETRLDALRHLGHLELLERLEALDAQLEHVHDLIVEQAAEHQAVRALLRVRAEHEQRMVILLGQVFLCFLLSCWRFLLDKNST